MSLWNHPRLTAALCTVAVLGCAAAPAVFLAAADAASLGRVETVADPYVAPTPPTVCPGMDGAGSLPLIRPCGATFPRGGRQGLLLAAAQASPYPGSWSSVRSWRVRL